MTPSDRRYTATHEWVKLENDSALVGITDHAQELLGDITFVELPKVGKVVTQQEAVAVVESVKAASDVYAPLAGTIAEVNAALASSPELVNQDPYGQGWLFRLRPVDQAGVVHTLDATAYDALNAKAP